MTNNQAIEVAAAWWANRLLVEDKRQQFRDALVVVLIDEWRKAVQFSGQHPDWGLHVKVGVDYDPDRIPRAALADVGIDCRGIMFSADGLFEAKTASVIRDGSFAIRDGRGAPWEDVFGVSGRAPE